jgi:membrane protein DedA with SNARE-associated domain
MHIILIYIGLFLGIFVEGEMIMISSIIAAHHGYLNLWLVVIIGVLGTYSSDVFYFMLGRKKGKEWLDHKIERYPILIFIIYRFLYGFRTVTPLVIGASGTKTGTFLFYCGLSTAIWAGTYCTIGYMFGALIKSKLGHIEHIEKYIIAGIVFIAIVVIVINALKMRRQRLTYL